MNKKQLLGLAFDHSERSARVYRMLDKMLDNLEEASQSFTLPMAEQVSNTLAGLQTVAENEAKVSIELTMLALDPEVPDTSPEGN